MCQGLLIYTSYQAREKQTLGHSLAIREPAPFWYPICGIPPYTHLFSAARKAQHTEVSTHFPVGVMVIPCQMLAQR